jgi:glycerophosphoryl diester phosphodiesterase
LNDRFEREDMAMRSALVTAVLLSAAVVGQAQTADLRLIAGATRVIAHRGGTGPDNTIAGCLRSIALGIPFLELDVQLTKDGKAVLIHDATVDRTTNGTGKVADLTFEQVRRFDAGVKYRDPAAPNRSFAGETIPTPREMLKAVGDRAVVLLEIHNEKEAEAVVDAIRAENAFQRAVVRNPNDALLMTVKRLDPRVMTGLSDTVIPPDGEMVSLLARLARLKVSAIDADNEERLTRRVVDEVHRAGVAVWGSNTVDVERWKRLHAAGVDAIMTNDPVGLQTWLRKASATSQSR